MFISPLQQLKVQSLYLCSKTKSIKAEIRAVTHCRDFKWQFLTQCNVSLLCLSETSKTSVTSLTKVTSVTR